MKYLRWFLGFILIVLLILLYDYRRESRPLQMIEPRYESSMLEGRDYVYYTVQSGDTLPLLERKFRIPSQEAILELNPGIDPDNLPVNRQIKIPLL